MTIEKEVERRLADGLEGVVISGSPRQGGGEEQSEPSSAPTAEDSDPEQTAVEDQRAERSQARHEEVPKGNTAISQLEQLENTNLLTVRIKWVNPENLMDDHKSQLLNRNNDAILCSRGIPINPSIIENYEYFFDRKRLEILKEHADVYTFESGTEEFMRSYEDGSSTWLYDLVVQAQFKAFQDLCAARNQIKENLEKSDHVEAWSISQNPHALTHPGNLYIRGIPKDLSVDDLIPIFSKFGTVLSLKIIIDGNTRESLGYGFISYPLGSQAARCIKELNGNLMNGSPLFINYHVERKERERIHLDHLKEDNDDERFRGVFVGNLPTEYEDGTLITPEQVFNKFNHILDPVDILSYYFPKRNSNTNIEYKDDDSTSPTSSSKENAETCDSQNEDSPLKGYGFIKFSTHDMALKAIDKLNSFTWLGHSLVVNKAVQNKTLYNNHSHYRTSSTRASISSRQSSLSGIPFFGPATPATSTLHHPPPPAFTMFAKPYSVSPTNSEVLLADRSPARSGSSNDGSPRVNTIPQVPLYGAQTQSHSPESLTAPGSRQGSLYLPSCPPMYTSAGTLMSSHPQFGHSAAHAAAAAFGGLPIPTRDQQESNLYVKHIPLSWRDEDLNDFYSQYGEIISAKIITVGGSKNEIGESKALEDVPVGTSRGYGFVCFKNPLDASRAMMATDRFQVGTNHVLYVSFAQKRGKSVSAGSGSSAGSHQPMSSSGRSSSHGSYHHGHGGSRQSPYDSIMGNYNPKFLNAMIQQQNQHLNGSPGTHSPTMMSQRNSWAPNQQAPYLVPVVMAPPPLTVPRSSPAMSSPKRSPDYNGTADSTVIDATPECGTLDA
ncbi:AEL217Wp [Eremothecium gossypii ATCC 10895]|uniref:AEL217Wp n=1 Tax=Eremothecium gossypii (strain ATCC 10895 / CBS 109.51 / FGSC 9923 / NRRL Y-1056) TaxID=284811 RepID=Q758H9_EREGS|nr:AEL217Wp [Eremothecium gossypii ATCC 10895]AAS52468.1 AEL217Wp [Eremothecium gossypii ATCC 10895]AEY96767.1 FAEL217Wp [Eremothecium gossypii FDAG1]